MTIVDIAKSLDCSRSTVYRMLNTFNLDVKGKNYPKPISKKELHELYANKRLTMPQIAKIYCCDTVTVHNRMKEHGISAREISEAHIQSPKVNFNGNNIEKAHMIGFRLGDLHVRKFEKNGKILNVSCGSSNINQIDLIKQMFSKYCKVTISKPDKRGITRINANPNESFNFLLEKKDCINKNLLKNRKTFFAFLAGYTDAEGTIKTHIQGFSTFRIKTYDKGILTEIKKQLEDYGYKDVHLHLDTKKSKVRKQNKDCWGVYVYKKTQLLKLYKELLPFIKHRDKRKDILDGIKNIEYRNKKYNNKRMEVD